MNIATKNPNNLPLIDSGSLLVVGNDANPNGDNMTSQEHQ